MPAFEVELKFRVINLAEFEAALRQRGAQAAASKAQIDRYFNHPSRDFAQTDEALRLRIDGDRPRITYKGPKIDKETKTRKEIELPIGETLDDLDQMSEMLTLLGFREVATVRKERRTFELIVEETAIEVALDEVAGVGSFVELEGAADEDTVGQVRQIILRLATDLGLTDPERRSYLELLLLKEPG